GAEQLSENRLCAAGPGGGARIDRLEGDLVVPHVEVVGDQVAGSGTHRGNVGPQQPGQQQLRRVWGRSGRFELSRVRCDTTTTQAGHAHCLTGVVELIQYVSDSGHAITSTGTRRTRTRCAKCPRSRARSTARSADARLSSKRRRYLPPPASTSTA